MKERLMSNILVNNPTRRAARIHITAFAHDKIDALNARFAPLGKGATTATAKMVANINKNYQVLAFA